MKKRMVLPPFLCILVLGFCLSAAAQDPEIVWCRFYGPPLYIFQDPLSGQGFGDKLLKRLPAILPGYSHTTMEGNLARTLSLLQSRDNACCATLIHSPERNDFIAYSDVAGWVLPNRFLVLSHRTSLIEPWITPDGLDLARLIGDGRISVGVIKQRAYGGTIDTILAKLRKSPSIHVVTKSVFGARMLFGERFDGLLAYAHEAMYYQKTTGTDKTFTSFPIIGETLQAVHFGCSNSPFGQKVIGEINGLLTSGFHREYLEHYREWLDPSARERIRNIAGQHP